MGEVTRLKEKKKVCWAPELFSTSRLWFQCDQLPQFAWISLHDILHYQARSQKKSFLPQVAFVRYFVAARINITNMIFYNELPISYDIFKCYVLRYIQPKVHLCSLNCFVSVKTLKILMKFSNILLYLREGFPTTLGLPTTPSLVQSELELIGLMSQALGCWDYRWMPSHSAYILIILSVNIPWVKRQCRKLIGK